MLPDRVLLGMSETRQATSWAGFIRHRPEDIWVALERHGLLGFGNCGPQRDRSIDFGGEVYTLYIAPDEQGRGLGQALLIALFRRLLRCGHESALVWVVRDNPSRFFYERLGGRLVLHRRIPLGGQPVEAIAYGWRDLSAALAGDMRGGRHLTNDP